MNVKQLVSVRVAIAGVLECKGKDGKVLSTIELKGALPLEQVLGSEQPPAAAGPQGEGHDLRE